MTIESIVTEICTEVNDPEEITYHDRALALYKSSVMELIDNNKFTEPELARLIENTEITITEGETSYDMDDTGHEVYRLLGLWRHPDELSSNITFTQIPYQQMGTITINDDLKPFSDEVLWSTGGDKIWTHANVDDNVEGNLRYIRPPLDNDYQYLNNIFNKKAIALAVQKLRIEIAGE